MVVFHCDDKKNDNSWEVLQFMPSCEVGAQVHFMLTDDQTMSDIDDEENYVKCMKVRIEGDLKYRKRTQGKSTKTKKPRSSCNNLLKEHDKLKFEFQWVCFKDLTQYLIPFCTVIGLIILAFIVGTIWDCCSQKKRDRYTKSGKSFV